MRLLRTAAGVQVMFVCTYLLGADNQSAPNNGSDIDVVLDAWKSRETSIRTARFEWTARVFTNPNSRLQKAMRNDSSYVLPPPDRFRSTIDERVTLLLAGDKHCYSRDTMAWSAKKQRYVSTPYVSAFDGKQARHLWTHTIFGYPLGTIFKGNYTDRSVPLGPPYLAYRPTGSPNAPISFDPEVLRKSWRVVQLDGRRTIKVQQRAGNVLCEAWVDPKTAMIRRFVLSSKGVTSWEANIEYDSKAMPSSWFLRSQDKHGDLIESIDARMTRVEINSKIPDDLFHIDFPVGSRISDQRREKKYVVQSSGSLREVLRSELVLPHDVLMRTKTGKAVAGNTWTMRVLFSLLFVVSMLALIWRRMIGPYFRWPGFR